IHPLPGLFGSAESPKIKDILTDVAVIILSGKEHQETGLDALAKGASGYLTKNTPPDKRVAAVNEVMLGGGPMSAHIAKMVVSSFQRSKESPLTRRETEILEQIAAGKTRSRIADELFIDLETVKSHLKHIYAKLDVHSKADAIKTAKANKFIKTLHLLASIPYNIPYLHGCTLCWVIVHRIKLKYNETFLLICCHLDCGHVIRHSNAGA